MHHPAYCTESLPGERRVAVRGQQVQDTLDHLYGRRALAACLGEALHETGHLRTCMASGPGAHRMRVRRPASSSSCCQRRLADSPCMQAPSQPERLSVLPRTLSSVSCNAADAPPSSFLRSCMPFWELLAEDNSAAFRTEGVSPPPGAVDALMTGSLRDMAVGSAAATGDWGAASAFGATYFMACAGRAAWDVGPSEAASAGALAQAPILIAEGLVAWC